MLTLYYSISSDSRVVAVVCGAVELYYIVLRGVFQYFNTRRVDYNIAFMKSTVGLDCINLRYILHTRTERHKYALRHVVLFGNLALLF